MLRRNKRTVKKDDKSISNISSEKSTFIELLQRQSPKKLKRGLGQSSLTNATSTPVSLECSSKCVRFATNCSPDGRVWTMIRTFKKVRSSHRDAVWWTEEELDKRHLQDMAMLSVVDVESKYINALRTVHVSSKAFGAQTVNFDFQTMSHCSAVRGLEGQVLPALKEHKKKHCRVVLGTQSLIRKNTSNGGSRVLTMNEAELRLIRIQSLKLSRANQLVALKMAELDTHEARQ
jgi:hypothetical protein